MNSRRAFTLIELLLVIAVIAVLMAIGLPALGAARASARQLQCLNNLRQIGLGTIAYRDTNKGLVPFAIGGVGGDGRVRALNALAPFGGWAATSIQSPTPLLVCPDDRVRAFAAGSSYNYLFSSLLFMALADGKESAALVVSRFVEQRPKEFVFRDDNAFHGRGTPFYQGVRMDGRVGKFESSN